MRRNRTNRGGRRAIWVLVLFGATGIAACTDTAAAPRGRLVAGFIVRDDATRDDIAATSSVALPGHESGDGALTLVVTKSRYRLDVLRRGQRLKTYPVALGNDPVGPKGMQGDSRTPEGRYVLFPHHPSPSFGGSFYVGYPGGPDAERGVAAGVIDARDRAGIRAALARGERPPHGTGLGGLILIHGTRRRSLPALTRRNWTDGCIAMENDDLVELLAAFTGDDRPIVEIRP